MDFNSGLYSCGSKGLDCTRLFCRDREPETTLVAGRAVGLWWSLREEGEVEAED